MRKCPVHMLHTSPSSFLSTDPSSSLIYCTYLPLLTILYSAPLFMPQPFLPHSPLNSSLTSHSSHISLIISPPPYTHTHTHTHSSHPNRTPYLLFTTQRSIYRLYLNGSDAEEILRPANFGVIAIDYHYRCVQYL